MQAQGESRGIALLILNLGAVWGWVVNATPGRFTPERLGEPLGRSRRAWRRENPLPPPPPTGVRAPNRSAWSGSLTDYSIPSRHTHTHTYCIYKCTYKVNIEARSRNHCCRGKEMSTAYAECVPIALVIQHAMRMRCVILLSVTPLALQSFSVLSHTWYVSRKKVIEHNMCVLIFSTTCVWNISHSNEKWVRYYHKCT